MATSKYIYPLLFSLVLLPLSSISLPANATEASAETVFQQSQQTQISQPFNINIASAEEIAGGLKGIGLKKAHAIVEWRENNGKFTSIEQLSEVKGIGEKTVMLNKSKISL